MNPLSDHVCEINHLTQAELLSSLSEKSLLCDQLNANFNFPRLTEVIFLQSNLILQLQLHPPIFQVEDVFDWLVEESKLVSAYKSSFILLLTGWTYLKENHLAKCYYCNRKWSLEQFVSKNLGDEVNKSDGEECSSINPISQHQSWCAWRHSSLGWQVQLEQLQQMRNSQDNPKRSRLDSTNYVRI